jgi:hypothetical protein
MDRRMTPLWRVVVVAPDPGPLAGVRARISVRWRVTSQVPPTRAGGDDRVPGA